MKIRLSDLWRWDGTVDRGPYFVLGLGLALIKFNLDRFVTHRLTGRRWDPLHYWIPGDVFRLMDGAKAYLPVLLLALPFVYVGVALTLRRLRAVRLPLALILLFFVPVVNLLFFTILSILPTRGPEGQTAVRRRGVLDRVIPADPLGSAAMSFALTIPATAGLTVLSATVLGSYGWGLFVGLPFLCGFMPVLLYGYHGPRSLPSCLLVGVTSLALLCGVLVALAVEGLICILMAAPIATVLATFGAIVGWLVQRRPDGGAEKPRIIAGLLALMPALLGAEHVQPSEAPLVEVRTAVDVAAPPERVWPHVVEFAELPPPDDWLFRSGIAYPMRAEIKGRGCGAIRHCVFSTGPFVEPIEVWDEPRLLKFGVTEQPPAMREWTLHDLLPTPHVDDYLVSRAGQFRLTPRADGGTRLEGTTWYQHRIWPAAYWRIWSDWIIHRIHGRVLEHIKRRAETP